MMLTIHGLPVSTKYHELKVLVKQESNISDFILDNLVGEGDGTKKVRIGVSDEREGAHLMKCLNGYRYNGHVLSVVPVGKASPMNPPQQNFDQRGGFPPRNNYPNQPDPEYNRTMAPAPGRPDPWGPGGGGNQWGPSPNQPQGQGSYSYQQGAGMNPAPYGQQRQPQQRPYEQRGPPPDQRYQGFQPKGADPSSQRQQDGRSHVLRSVEIIDEPLSRPIAQPNRYPPTQGYDMPQKPGPQYNLDRQPNPPGVYQGHPGQGHTGLPGQGHGQPSSWDQTIPPQKSQPFPKPGPAAYDRKYPEPDKRPATAKAPVEPSRNIDNYHKPYDKGHGPRFSPRRDAPKDGPRFSPRRDIPKDGPRFSPRRDIIKEPRFSPRRDIKDGPGPRFSPRRDKDGPRFSPRKDGPRFSPRKDGPRFSPRKDGPRFSPRKDGPRFSPRKDGPRFSPRRDKDGPRFSPRRDIKDGPGPRFSPRRDGRRDSPGGRRVSSPGRRVLSPGRRLSPPGRRNSPGDRRQHVSRRESPGHKRASPGRRPASPRRGSPPRHGARFSQPRRVDKPPDKFVDVSRSAKDVRPAYEPPAQAPNQAMYAGGYRPNVHENVQYPIPGVRQDRGPTWQQQDKPSFSAVLKKDDDRRMSKFEPRVERILEANMERKRSRSPPKSRSPINRDRSPLRYKKGSSPPSPRRSWALEKRRSPDIHDAPPPPLWPGQNMDDGSFRKRPFPDREDDEPKRTPVWDRSPYDEKTERHRRPEEERRFTDASPIRVRTDLGPRPTQSSQAVREKPSPRGFHQPNFEPRQHEPKFEPRQIEPNFEPRQHQPKFESRQHEPKFEPRHHEPKFEPRHHEPKFEPRQLGPKFEPRRHEPKFEPREREPKFESRQELPERRDFHRPDDRNFDRPDFRDQRPDREGREDPIHSRREEFPRREDRREPAGTKVPEFNKEFDDVYKRSVEFKKRVQELRKNDDRGRDDYQEDRSGHDLKDYDRQKFQEDRHRDYRQDDRHNEPRHHDTLDVDAGKTKREMAAEDITDRLIKKHGTEFPLELKERVREELNISIARILKNLYGTQDVSFIEMVVKFKAKFNDKLETKILQEVMSCLPSHYRSMKRAAEDTDRPEVAAKAPRHSHESNLKEEFKRTVSARQHSSFHPIDSKMKPALKTKTTKVIQRSVKMVPQPGKPMRKTKPEHKTIREKPMTKVVPKTAKPVRAAAKKAPTADKPVPTADKVVPAAAKPVPTAAKPVLTADKLAPTVAKPVPTADKPVTTADKPVPMVDKPVSTADKPVPTADKPVPMVDKPVPMADKPKPIETKPATEVTPKPKCITPSVEPPPDGHHELNPLMTSMLENELQHIMIKVWQELPDEPPSEAEKLVADKFRNKAGDDLLNVLGLNVTKRLLNVHNPLYVKISFSRKPEAMYLKSFLRKYNCTGLRRLPQSDYSFAVQLDTVADFDRICSAKSVRCGDARLTITPAYKFNLCPKKLKTIYKDINNSNTTDDIEITDENHPTEKKKEVKIESEKKAPEIVQTDKKNEEIDKEATESNAKIKSQTVPDTKPDESSETKNASQSTVVTSKIGKTPAVTAIPIENEDITKSNATKVSNTAITPKAVTKVTESAAPKATVNSKQTEAKTIVNKPSNVTANKSKVNKSPIATQKPVNKRNADAKTAKKKVGPKLVQNKTNKTKDEIEFSDNDELDDGDILALMSEAIILDECGGSDED